MRHCGHSVHRRPSEEVSRGRSNCDGQHLQGAETGFCVPLKQGRCWKLERGWRHGTSWTSGASVIWSTSARNWRELSFSLDLHIPSCRPQSYLESWRRTRLPERWGRPTSSLGLLPPRHRRPKTMKISTAVEGSIGGGNFCSMTGQLLFKQHADCF